VADQGPQVVSAADAADPACVGVGAVASAVEQMVVGELQGAEGGPVASVGLQAGVQTVDLCHPMPPTLNHLT